MNLSKAEFQDQTHSSVADDGTARSWLLRGKSVTRGWLDTGHDDLVHLPITVIPPRFLDDTEKMVTYIWWDNSFTSKFCSFTCVELET